MKSDWGDNLDVRYYVCEKLKQIKGKSILDIGCGQGYLASYIDKSNDYLGIDTDYKDIQEAKESNPNKTFECKEFRVDNKKKFDVVLAINIIEVMNDRAQGVKDAILSTNTGGVIILTTPNGNNQYYRNKKKIKEEDLKEWLKGYNYKIYYWNPFPIQIHHLCKFFPVRDFFIRLFKSLMRFKFNSVSFYVEIYV